MRRISDETFIDHTGETWLSVDQVSRRLGCDVRHLVNLAARGLLQVYRLGSINLYKLSQVQQVSIDPDATIPRGRYAPNPLRVRGSRGAAATLEYLEDSEGARWISSSLAAHAIAKNNQNDTINHNRVDEFRRMGRLQRTLRLGAYHLYDSAEVEAFRFGERKARPRLPEDQLTDGARRKRRFDERRRAERLTQKSLVQ